MPTRRSLTTLAILLVLSGCRDSSGPFGGRDPAGPLFSNGAHIATGGAGKGTSSGGGSADGESDSDAIHILRQAPTAPQLQAYSASFWARRGTQTTVFFTFWGLNVIRRQGARTTAKDWLRRLFGVLNRGGADSLPLSKFHFWGMGTGMMKKVMRQHRMPGIAELMQTAQDLGVRFIACTTTMGLMGISKDTLIEGVDQLAGVTTYLAEAKQGYVAKFQGALGDAEKALAS